MLYLSPAFLLLLFLLPGIVFAQSRGELRTLFFDGVYLEDPEEILLSSSGRTGGEIIDSGIYQPPSPEQPPSEALSSIRDYERSINQLIESAGAFTPQLSQEYLSLGNLYQRAGNFSGAVEAYEKAMHINRVNEGLFSLSQVAAVRALIDGYKDSRNFADADQYHEYLYYLLKQNLEPGSEELVEASVEWADWNLEAFRRMVFNDEEDLAVSGTAQSGPAAMLRRGELIIVENRRRGELQFIPRSTIYDAKMLLDQQLRNPLFMRNQQFMEQYSAQQLIDPRLKNAEALYDELLESDRTNKELILKKANVTYLFKTQLEELVDGNLVSASRLPTSGKSVRSVSVIRKGYSETGKSLLALADSLEAEAPLEAARTYINLGDWELAYDRSQRAYDAYNMAREVLLGEGFNDEQVSSFITPEPAIVAPEFTQHQYTRSFLGIPEERDIPYIGYIDVSFTKRKNGSLRNIDIENSSEKTGQRVESLLKDFLREIKVRPLMVAGTAEEQSDIKVRYYYSY